MINYFLNSVPLQIGSAFSITVALCVAAYIFPVFRKHLLTAAAIVGTLGFAYARGARNQAQADKRKRDAMVAKKQEEYNEIDNRRDSPADAIKRMRDNGF